MIICLVNIADTGSSWQKNEAVLFRKEDAKKKNKWSIGEIKFVQKRAANPLQINPQEYYWGSVHLIYQLLTETKESRLRNGKGAQK